MWRNRWWRMFDRDPIMNWLHGRIALLGDSAHAPLQYMAQGAVMALEDGWVLTALAWGEMWHLEGLAREQRNTVLRGRDARDYSFTDWIYGPTALVPEDEPDLYRTIPLDEAAREPVLVE